MSTQDKNRSSSEKNGYKENRSNLPAQERKDQGPRRERSQPGEVRQFNEDPNERQRVGDTSDQNWWDSGTNQQQKFYRGDTAYPYRENFDNRNQQYQEGVENYYPQEPASAQQRQNFAEGSQYPYEGGFKAGNLQAREGLERAKGLESEIERSRQNRQESGRENLQQGYSGRRQENPNPMPAWARNQQVRNVADLAQFNSLNQMTNQNQNTMRPDERNYNRYNNNYRVQDQDFGRDRNSTEDRDFYYENGSRGPRYERDHEREGFYPNRRDSNRDHGQEWDYNRDRYQGRSSDFDRDFNQNRYGNKNEGPYHSTRTEIPGRGYESEQEMNRHSHTNYEDFQGERNYGDRNRNYRGERNHGVTSRHRATGRYEDFERDIDRFGLREDYQNRGGSYERENWDRDRARAGNRGFYIRSAEEEGRRRPSYQNQDPRLDRGPSGSWGRQEREYHERYDRDRDRDRY